MAQNLALIFLSIATIFLLQPVKGDEALIRTVCGWTPEQDACLNCLHSAVGSGYKDQTELAAISINCAISLSNEVINDFSGIANSTGDNAVKDICARCEQIIGDALISLQQAILDWSNGQFRSAGDDVGVAGNKYSDCANIAQNIPAPPTKFSGDFSLLKKDYSNTQAILYKL